MWAINIVLFIVLFLVFTHVYLEIMEQPESLARALNYGGRILGDDSAKLGGLGANTDVISNIKHLLIAACGTSYFSGLLGAHYMRQLGSFETVQGMKDEDTEGN